jgi:hypothetical protein
LALTVGVGLNILPDDPITITDAATGKNSMQGLRAELCLGDGRAGGADRDHLRL